MLFDENTPQGNQSINAYAISMNVSGSTSDVDSDVKVIINDFM